MTTDTSITNAVRVEDIELYAEDLDVERAAAIYQEHGCLVVRGLMRAYVTEMTRDIEAAATQSIALLDQARQVPEGWVTPNGTLFLPAPLHFARDKQIMVLAVNYYTSAAFFRSAPRHHQPLSRRRRLRGDRRHDHREPYRKRETSRRSQKREPARPDGTRLSRLRTGAYLTSPSCSSCKSCPEAFLFFRQDLQE